MGIFVKALPHLRCVAAFTNIPVEIMHSVCTKVNLKSDFHIAGQLMETHPEYSNIRVRISNVENEVEQRTSRDNSAFKEIKDDDLLTTK